MPLQSLKLHLSLLSAGTFFLLFFIRNKQHVATRWTKNNTICPLDYRKSSAKADTVSSVSLASRSCSRYGYRKGHEGGHGAAGWLRSRILYRTHRLSGTLVKFGKVKLGALARRRSSPATNQVHFILFFLKLVITGSSHHGARLLRFSEGDSPPFPATNNTNENLCLYSKFWISFTQFLKNIKHQIKK